MATMIKLGEDGVAAAAWLKTNGIEYTEKWEWLKVMPNGNLFVMKKYIFKNREDELVFNLTFKATDNNYIILSTNLS